MKRHVVAAFATAIIFGSSARAAGIGGWSGFYIGGNAGLGWHDRTAVFICDYSKVRLPHIWITDLYRMEFKELMLFFKSFKS